MSSLASVMLALFSAYLLHWLALICETVLEGSANVICRRCCRMARWASIFAVGCIAIAYGFEWSAHVP